MKLLLATDQFEARPRGEAVHWVELVKLSEKMRVPRCAVTGTATEALVALDEATVTVASWAPAVRADVDGVRVRVPGALAEVGDGTSQAVLLEAVQGMEPVPVF